MTNAPKVKIFLSPVLFLRRFRFLTWFKRTRAKASGYPVHSIFNTLQGPVNVVYFARTFFTWWAVLRVLVSYSRFPFFWSLTLSGKYNRQSQSVSGATFLRVFHFSFGCRKETLCAGHSEQCNIVTWVVRKMLYSWQYLLSWAVQRDPIGIWRKSYCAGLPLSFCIVCSDWFSFKPHEKRNGITRIPIWLPFRFSRWERVQNPVCGKVVSWRHVWGVIVEVSTLAYTPCVTCWLIWAFLSLLRWSRNPLYLFETNLSERTRGEQKYPSTRPECEGFSFYADA